MQKNPDNYDTHSFQHLIGKYGELSPRPLKKIWTKVEPQVANPNPMSNHVTCKFSVNISD